jgi:hypothetical protein
MQVPTDCGSPIQLIQRHDRAFPCHDWYCTRVTISKVSICSFWLTGLGKKIILSLTFRAK